MTARRCPGCGWIVQGALCDRETGREPCEAQRALGLHFDAQRHGDKLERERYLNRET